MKQKKVFWGIFFIFLGLLTLLFQYDIVELNLSSLIDFWPVLFIFWGLAIMSKDTAARPFISALSSIFLVLLIIGFFQFIFDKEDINYKFDDISNSSYYYEMSDSIKFATLTFNSGAGTFKLGGTTDQLVEAKAKTKNFEYRFNVNQFDSLARVRYELSGNESRIDTDYKNIVDMKLNSSPVWDLILKMGAAKSKIDLSDYKVRKIDLNCGAADLTIKVGDRQSLTYFDAEIGAVDLKFYIPQDSGCKIKFNQFLISKDLSGFNKIGDGTYITPDFENAENQIIMNIDGGVSNFEVERY